MCIIGVSLSREVIVLLCYMQFLFCAKHSVELSIIISNSNFTLCYIQNIMAECGLYYGHMKNIMAECGTLCHMHNMIAECGILCHMQNIMLNVAFMSHAKYYG